MGAHRWLRAAGAPALRRRTCPYPYGLLAPVARVGSASAAEEVRGFLDSFGIRSTVAPSPARRPRLGQRARLHLQVLVFVEDVARARRLVNQWTLPAHTTRGA